MCKTLRPSFTSTCNGLARNYYCLGCDTGPFNKSDLNTLLIEKGYGNQPVYYCRTCNSKKFNTELTTIDESFTQREIYIKSGKAMHNTLLSMEPAPSKETIEASCKAVNVLDKQETIVRKFDIIAISEEDKNMFDISKSIDKDMPRFKPEKLDIILAKPQHEVKQKVKETIVLSYLTAREIVDIVFKKTNEKIIDSLKNKKAIVRKAKKIFEEKGYECKLDKTLA